MDGPREEDEVIAAEMQQVIPGHRYMCATCDWFGPKHANKCPECGGEVIDRYEDFANEVMKERDL